MKKKKNILKSFGLLASACLVCSGGLLLGLNKLKEETCQNNVFAYAALEQDSREFFATSQNIVNDYIFINENDTQLDSYARLYFDVAAETNTDIDPMSFKGTYYNGSQYLGFTIESIQISLNGQDINTSFDTTIQTITDANHPFIPQTFDMYMKIDNSADQSYFVNDGGSSTNILALHEQGLVTVTINYTEYVNVAKLQSGTYLLENEEQKTNQKITYNLLVLDKNEYLEYNNEDSPKVAAADFTQQTASKTINYDHNFFAAYDTNNIPSVTYNPYDYELSFSFTDKEKQTSYYKIVYNYSNNSFVVTDHNGNEVTAPVGLKQISNKELALYFYDLGEYSLNYNGIYVNNNEIYKIDKDFKGQKVYVYGYQNFYTISSGNYAELKTYDEKHASYTLASDKTAYFTQELEKLSKTLYETDNDEKTLLFENNEVTTNKTPIRFNSIEGVSPTSNSGFYYRPNSTSSWSDKQDFITGKDFSSPGHYIIYLNYNYSNFTDAFGDIKASETFEQYFMFEISNSSIEFDVYTKDINTGEIDTVANKEFTNQDVFISYDQFNNSYNKNISFYIVKYDYENGCYFSSNGFSNIYIEQDDIPAKASENNIYPAELIDWSKDGVSYKISDEGEVKITANGNYGVYAFREDLVNPAARLFNIDKDTEFNLASYTVEQSSSTKNYYATKPVSNILSNEPLVFSWDNMKASGAQTYGSFKRYDIEEKELYDGNFFNRIYNFISKNIIPVEYQLDVSEANWRAYDNFNYEANPSRPVTTNYKRTDPGLYVFQTYDDAGNSQTKIYIIDNSAPVFFAYNYQSKTYSVMSGYDTLSSDTQVIWGKYKAISLGSQTLNTTELYKGRKETNGSYYDFNIEQAFSSLISKAELVEPHEGANLTYLSLPNSSSPYTGYYLVVDIEDELYFKNYFTNDYEFITSSETNYTYDIVSSYKLYAISNTPEGTVFYRSTTNSENTSEGSGGSFFTIDPKVQNPEVQYISNTSNIKELSIWGFENDNENLFFEYNSEYYRFNPRTNLMGDKVNVTNGTYESKKLEKKEFIDKEGTYVFILRDSSATKGSNLAKENQYLSHPSAFEYATISADESRLTIGFKPDGNDILSLMDSSIFSTESSSKTVYFVPTNEEKLYISFIPTKQIGEGENAKYIQVDSVTVEYYAFETACSTTLLDEFSVNQLYNLTMFNYYQTLSATPSDPDLIYSYDRDGKKLDEKTNESITLEYELNVNDNKTSAGMYVITRTYVEKGGEFIVSPYDYQTRIANSIVDRYNPITESKTMNPEITKYTAIFTYKTDPSKVFSMDMFQTNDTMLYISKNSIFTNIRENEDMLSFIQITLEGSEPKLLSSLNLSTYNTYTDKNGKAYYVYTAPNKILSIQANLQGYYNAALESEKITVPSTQSLVGGSILVTTYSSYSSDPTKNGSIISLAYPGQTTTEMMLYGDGSSFYTSEDTSNLLNLNYSFETNKLPVSISVPKYKFTEYFTKRLESDLTAGKEFVVNTVYENAGLSYYGSEKNASNSIQSYELEVEVSFYAGVGDDASDLKLNDLSIPTEVYKSNGDVENGYLVLYKYSNGQLGDKVSDFYQAGRYIVKVTQDAKEIEASAYNFKKSYNFAFDIKESQPKYNIYGGTLLKSVEDLNFFEEKASISGIATYYTNTDDLSITWTDTRYEYKANIDKKNIVLNLNNAKTLTLTLNPTNQSVSTSDSSYNRFFSYEYNSTALTNTLKFNLKDFKLNSNGAFVDVTMKFEGHDATEYYKATTKRIVYDQTASDEIITNLHSFINYDLPLDNIREYYLADGRTKTTKEFASYNQTNTTHPYYNNYSFVTTKDFFEALQDQIRENITNISRNNSTTMAYYKVVDYPVNYKSPTSNTNDFVEGDFTQITNSTTFTDMENKYYEIVEKDLAGNLTIYVIYVSSLDAKKVVGGDEILQGLSYKHSAEQEKINILDSLLLSNKIEISGSTDLILSDLNYRGDEWQYFYTEKYNTVLGLYYTSHYLMTPTIEDGYCYQVTGTANKTYTKVALSEVLGNDSNGYKKYVYILDKTTGLYNKVNIAQSNTASLTYTTSETGNNAYISIVLPTTDFVSDEFVRAYPVKISLEENGTILYYCENDPQSTTNLQNENYSYVDIFLNESNNTVSAKYENGFLVLAIQNVINDTKFNIEIVDNFGKTKKDVYLVGETKVDAVTSNGNLYSYYKEIDNSTNLVYLSSKDLVFSYNTVKYIPKIYLYNGFDFEEININTYSSDNLEFSTYTRGTIASFVATPKISQYDYFVKVCLIDKDNPEGEVLTSYYLNLYNKLPTKTDDTSDPNDYFISITNSNGSDDTENLISINSNENKWEEVTIGGNTYKVCSSRQTFSDELRISYKNPSSLAFPYEVLYFYDIENWENGTDFVPLESGTRINKNGIYYILVKYSSQEVLTKEYYVYKIEILGSTATNYFIYANGKRIERASTYYTDITNMQHSEYYIVNINHEDRNIKEKFEIMTNDYQQIASYEIANTTAYYKAEGSGIYTYKYIITNYKWFGVGAEKDEKSLWRAPNEEGIEAYYHVIFVTYLNPSNNILKISEDTTSGISYKTDDSAMEFVKSSTSQVKVVVYEDTADTNSMTIYWNKSYGIAWNKITMTVEKDGRQIDIQINENEFNYYTTLTRSGSYLLKFQDEAGNVQSFYSGMTTLPLIFIKDVHFTTTYTNPLTNEIVETEAINKAVYNGEVKLTLNKLLIPYYQTSTFGGGNIIKVTKDGQEYSNYIFSNEDYSFTFSEAGYYVLYMLAYDKEPPNAQIRAEQYAFTIINPRESRYAYNFNGYQDYFIKSIVKDGIDVTEALTKSLGTSSNMISVTEVIDGVVIKKDYLRRLLVSFYDEKTGSGRYQITICANDKLYLNSKDETTSFTFEFFINSKPVPIYVSIPEGATTNKPVNVTFNAKNVFDTVGECLIYVPGNEPYKVTSETTEDVSLTISSNVQGLLSCFVQVTTMSGNVLYSYKIVLKEAMNAWTWIAIVGGALLIAAVTFIIVKLRKKIGVK